MPIETFNISFESIQSKQHMDGTKLTGTEGKKVLVIRNLIVLFSFFFFGGGGGGG